jgi:hypothetical protein
MVHPFTFISLKKIKKEIRFSWYKVPRRVFGWMLDECINHTLHG